MDQADYDSYLQVLMTMSEGERAVFLQEEIVNDELGQLDTMALRNQTDDEFIRWAVDRAKYYMEQYEDDGNEVALLKAEQYMQLAKLVRAGRYTVADFRKQRERVWQEKKRLQKIPKPSPSDEPPVS